MEFCARHGKPKSERKKIATPTLKVFIWLPQDTPCSEKIPKEQLIGANSYRVAKSPVKNQFAFFIEFIDQIVFLDLVVQISVSTDEMLLRASVRRLVG